MAAPEPEKLLFESITNPIFSQQAINLIATAHFKIASVHLELATELQLLASETHAKIAPLSPGSDSTVSACGNVSAVIEDDDFADSPMLNPNAWGRAMQKSKNPIPLVNRMKLKKAASDLPKRSRQPNAYSIFQKENFAKVGKFN